MEIFLTFPACTALRVWFCFAANLIFFYERLLCCFKSVFGVKFLLLSFSLWCHALFLLCAMKTRDNSKSTVLCWCFRRAGASTEQETRLYHDVLIIQRKLCFSFFTVFLFFTVTIVPVKQDVTSGFTQSNVGKSTEQCIKTVSSSWTLFAYIHNGNFFLNEGSFIVCSFSCSLNFPSHFTDLCWHFPHFSFSFWRSEENVEEKRLFFYFNSFEVFPSLALPCLAFLLVLTFKVIKNKLWWPRMTGREIIIFPPHFSSCLCHCLHFCFCFHWDNPFFLYTRFMSMNVLRASCIFQWDFFFMCDNTWWRNEGYSAITWQNISFYIYHHRELLLNDAAAVITLNNSMEL